MHTPDDKLGDHRATVPERRGSIARVQQDGSATVPRRPRVVTITVNFNSRPWLAECFATVTASRTRHADLEFVLVDNACTDGSAELVTQRHPSVTVLTTTRNEGFAGANNLGLRYALARGADFVFLLNPDTRTPPDLLDRLVEFLDAWPEYGIVGPMQYRYTSDGAGNGKLNDWSLTALRAGESNIFDLDTPGLPSPAGPVSGRAPGTLEHAYVQGAALMCRAEALRGVGLFDETYHSYYEECDLCRRTRWGGWRVALCTNLGIQHFGGRGNSQYRRRMMLRNKYYFLVTDPEYRARDITRLTFRWLARDLMRQGAAPAERLDGDRRHTHRRAVAAAAGPADSRQTAHTPAAAAPRRRRAARHRSRRRGTAGVKIAIVNPPHRLPSDASRWITVPPQGYGTVQWVCAHLIRGLRALGHQVTLLGAPGSRTDPGVTVVDATSANDFDEWAATTDVDIVHDHTNGLINPRVVRRRAQFISTHHLTGPPRHPQSCVYVSSAQRADAEGPVVPVPVDPPLLRFAATKDDYLLFLGRISPHKGVYEAAAFAKAARCQLVVAGPSWEPDYLRRIQTSDDGSTLHLEGEVGGARRVDLLSRARAILVLSQQVPGPWGHLWSEPGATVVSEAAASGTPTIATRNGCLPELTVGVGRHVPYGAEFDPAQAARLLAELPRPEQVRKIATERWHFLTISRRYEELYQHVLAGRRWGNAAHSSASSQAAT